MAKRIVVDASVARSAGPVLHPDLLPGQCRAVLVALLETGHSLVLSPEGLAEWRRHASEFSRSWLVQMFARRRVLHIEGGDGTLRTRLARLPLTAANIRAIVKDAHLIEAALETDRLVLSRDEEARGLFRGACHEVHELREIHWANPEIEDEEVAPWLREGAREEARRKLGAP